MTDAGQINQPIKETAMDELFAEMREKAERATQPNAYSLYAHGGGRTSHGDEKGNCKLIHDTYHAEERDYYNVVGPANVLLALDEIKRLRAENKRLRSECESEI